MREECVCGTKTSRPDDFFIWLRTQFCTVERTMSEHGAFETFWANSSGGFEGLETFFLKKSSFPSSLSLSSSCLFSCLASSLLFHLLISSLFFHLLLSFLVSPLSSVSLCLCLSLSLSLSVSVSVWCCVLWCCVVCVVVVVVSLLVMVCVCVCVCVCCGTLKKRERNRVWIQKRLRVCIPNVPVCAGTTRTCVSTCARGAGTHGDVLNLHTEGVLYIHTGSRGSSLVLLTKICPRMVITWPQRSTKETRGSYPFSV